MNEAFGHMMEAAIEAQAPKCRCGRVPDCSIVDRPNRRTLHFCSLHAPPTVQAFRAGCFAALLRGARRRRILLEAARAAA